MARIFVHRESVKTCHKHLQKVLVLIFEFLTLYDECQSRPNLPSVSKKTVRKAYREMYRVMELDELANMLIDPILRGDLEADETFLKSGGKYKGRGRYISTKNSMVFFLFWWDVLTPTPMFLV